MSVAMYQENILDHYEHPYHRGALETPTLDYRHHRLGFRKGARCEPCPLDRSRRRTSTQQEATHCHGTLSGHRPSVSSGMGHAGLPRRPHPHRTSEALNAKRLACHN